MAFRFNPYQPKKMIAPGMFTGRTEELRAIEKILYQTKFENPQHFLIEGERGIGKLSLLFLLAGVASGLVPSMEGSHFNFLTVSVDLGGVHSQADIVKTIARQLRTVISEEGRLKEKATEIWNFASKFEAFGIKFKGEVTELSQDDMRDELIESIVQFSKRCAGQSDGIVILIDEADAPSESAGLGEFVKFFTERLSRRYCNNVLLGLSGLPSLIAKLGSGLVDHSQKMTVAAMQMADMKVWAQRS